MPRKRTPYYVTYSAKTLDGSVATGSIDIVGWLPRHYQDVREVTRVIEETVDIQIVPGTVVVLSWQAYGR